MGKQTLMVIGAHADDIEFNFGGTALKYHEKFGYEIVYIMSTNNMSGSWNRIVDGKIQSSENPWYVIMPQRKLEAAKAASNMFHTEAIHLDHPQRHYRNQALEKIELRYGAPAPDLLPPNTPTILTAHEVPECVERLAGLILEKNPEVIITHAPAEPCMEHQGTNLLVRKAYHKAQSMGYDGSFVCGLTVSPMGVGDFFDRYDTFIDISGYFQKKLEGIVIHSCQVPRHDHLELRDPNVGKTVGCEHAEAYTVANLSKTRTGELTGEFKKNHKYCIENWMKIFSVKE